MEVIKVSAFSLQTALKYNMIYWIQNQYNNGTRVSQICTHLPKGKKPSHTNLALGV